MRKWTAEEMNIFFSILTVMRDEGTREIHLDKFELADIANYSVANNKRYYDTIRELIEKLGSLRYYENNSHSLKYMPFFTYFEATWEEDLSNMDLQIQVNERFEYILNQWNEGNWTKFVLNEFLAIDSTYSKTLFRLLKQWKTVGQREFSVEEFKRLMDIPESYSTGMINTRIIKNALDDLKPYFLNLKVKIVKSNKRGNPVTGYLFTWSPEKTGKWIENKFDDDSQRTIKKNYDKFSDWLIDYDVVERNDRQLIKKFEEEVFPIYQDLADRSSLDTVAKHISYVAHQNYSHPIGYFKKAAKDYLKKYIDKS